MEKKVFLLGGHDLEMQEIARLLDREKVLYFDRNLSWDNACVEAYAVELQRYGDLPEVSIYGVELRESPGGVRCGNYVLIDHHNAYQRRKSSLQQTAEILGVELTHFQRLVAANDAGYIPAMQALGATEEEIGQIRRKDRAAQGVTPEDEELAEKAIGGCREVIGDLTVVRALSPRFSPICDRLWPYRKLLIYTDETFCYYGERKDRLVEEFKGGLSAGKMYHGGGDSGFIGVVQGSYTPEEVVELLERVKMKLIEN